MKGKSLKAGSGQASGVSPVSGVAPPEEKRFRPGQSGNPGGVSRAQRAAILEVRGLSQGMLSDPEYRESLRKRLLAGELAPAMETLLWHYAYGKPADNINLNLVRPEEIPKLPDAALRALANGEELPDAGDSAPN